VAETAKHIPFEIKRAYWITASSPALEVGNHAHQNLSQVFVALNGSIEVSLTFLSGKVETFDLNSPGTGLFVPPMHWKRLKFSPDAILLCLTSHLFEDNDYIKNLDEFLALGK
jgi:hypothetical protein